MCTEADDRPSVTEVCGGESCSVSTKSVFSEALTRDDRRNWPSSVCSHPGILGRVSFNCLLVLSSAAANRADPSASLTSSFGMRRCELVVALVQLFGTGIQDTLHWDPTARNLLCDGTSSLLYSPSTVRPGNEAPSPRVSQIRHECRTRCHCHLETKGLVFDPHPIFPTQGFS